LKKVISYEFTTEEKIALQSVKRAHARKMQAEDDYQKAIKACVNMGITASIVDEWLKSQSPKKKEVENEVQSEQSVRQGLDESSQQDDLAEGF
jgi:hypothetical protein